MRMRPWNCGSNIAVSAAAFDSLVEVLVDNGKVIEYLPFVLGQAVELCCRHGGKLVSQLHKGLGVEFVLVRLREITQVSIQGSGKRVPGEEPTLRFPRWVKGLPQPSRLQ